MKPWLLTRSFSNQVFVYPIGVPFLFATILFVNRRAIKNETRGGDNWLVRDSNPTLERLAVLYDVYKPEKWWWEVSPKPKRSCGLERIQTHSHHCSGVRITTTRYDNGRAGAHRPWCDS